MTSDSTISGPDSDQRSDHSPDHDSDRNSNSDSDHNSNSDSDYGVDYDDIEWTRYCVPRRCRLCTYPIKPNELMVASDLHGEVSSPFRNEPFNLQYEVRLKEEFRPCPPACAHDQIYLRGCVPGYHAECFSYAGKSCPPPGLLSATECSFEPMPSHDLERQKRTTQLLATKVGNLWPCLPHELCLMISALVVREYTVSVFQGLWAARHQLPNHNVDVSQSIWVRYSDMGGAKYVYELSNTGGRCFRKLFDPEISPDPGVLYVLEDHLGVRDLVFHNPESKRMRLPSGNHERGTWWRVISLPYKLQVEYDGIKLRKINQGHSSNPRDVVFSVPLPPEEVAALELYRRPLVPLDPETPLKNLQMVPFHINGPGVIGYSFCWSERLFYLHAHHEEDNLAMYKDFDTLTEDPFWIHLPIAPDEYINSVWFRRAAYTSDLALWITTNKGNQTIVGPTEAHPILQNSNLAELFPGAAFEWVRLIGPLNEGQSVQMYFNLSERGIKVFATLQPNIAITPGPGPPEWLRSAYSTDHGSWFSESAWLINVVEIIPFQKKASGSVKRVQGEKPYFDAWGSHSPIIGLVLVYSNGARVCLGQVRLDCATPPIDMRHVTTFYMAFRQARRNPYLSEIRLSAPTTPDDMATAWRWLKIDLSQRTVLEWHLYKGFHSGCHVRYGDQTTFEDE